jgi:RNA polymerase sigma-70 factor (ECF subfamily)
MDRTSTTFRPESLLAHREWVERAARALVHGDADALDLQQQVWLEVLEKPPAVEPASPRGWLWSVLRFTAIDAGRSARTRRRHETAAARPERLNASPAELVARAETLDRVAHAVLELEEPYRATVLLRYFEGLEAPAIAGIQGIPVETVRTRLKRAVARLRARLDAENEGERRGWVLALLPLLRRPSTGTGAGVAGTATTTAAGVLLMGTKTKVAVAAAVLLLAGTGGWVALRPPPRTEAPRVPAVASVPASPPVPSLPLPVPAPPLPDEGPRLAGFVVTRDGTPVAGARVTAAPDTSAEAADPAAGGAPTDAKGAFSLPVPAGSSFCDLLAEAAGFSPGILRSARPGRDLRIVLEPEAALLGKVMDLEGAPVAGARVRWLGTMGSVRVEREATSGADGDYRVAGVPGPVAFEFQRHGVEVTAAGFAPQYIDIGQAAVEKGGNRRLDVWLLRGAVLRGRVVDAEDGHPLGGARVVLWSIEGATSYPLPDGGYAGSPYSCRRLGEAVADNQGAFRFEGVPAWGVRPVGINTADTFTRWLGCVGAVAEGHAPMGVRLTVPREGETVSMDIPCWPEAFLEGRVVTRAGAPVAGAHVYILDAERPSWGLPAWFSVPGRPSYETDAEGNYRIGWVSAPTRSSGRLEVKARGPRSGLGDPGPGQEVSVTGRAVTLVPDLVLEDGPAAPCVDVLVLDVAGSPVAGALVFQSEWMGQRPEGRTDEAGRVRVFRRGATYVEGMPKTTVRLRVTHPGFATAATEELTPSREDPPQVRVVLTAGHGLAGRVLRPDGSPVAGAGVTVADGSLPADRLFSGDQGFGEGAWRVVSLGESGPSGTVDLAWATTGPDGTFSFEDLPAGPWHVCAWKYARVVPPEKPTAVRARAESVPSGTADLSMVLDVPSGSPAPEGSVAVEGTLRDGAAGKPILKSSVEMASGGKTVWARAVAPGRFRFDSVTPGTWTLRLTAEGYDPVLREGIVVGPDGPTEPIDVVLDAGLVLRGVLRFPATDGTPAVRLLLMTNERGAGRPSLDVRPDGTFDARGLKAGATYRPLAVERDARENPRMWVPPGAREFTVPPVGVPEPVEWTLVRAGCLYVKVASPRLLPAGSFDMATEEQKTVARESVVEFSDAAGTVLARANLLGNNVCAAYLPPGSYSVRVTLPGGATQTKPATLETGTLKIEFDFP